MKKINFKELLDKLNLLRDKIQESLTFVSFLTVVAIYGIMVLRISQLSSAQPSEEARSEKLNVVKRSRLDQASIDQIQQLRDQNVQVQVLFEQARDNPFQD